ncbi:MAG: M48 family metallopeptidase [Bacteroidetes bacterium]|nr:M48 family metallopeptidase [Bacteroidota bacterium]MDA1121473.1 M48 family metallopeptidase [Bacteroidota bacterium]
MTPETILIIMIAIITLDFIIERVLSFLNSKNRKKDIPKELEGIYEEEKYRKSQRYQDELERFGQVTSTFSFVLIIVVLSTGAFGILDDWLRQYALYDPIRTLMFFGALFILSDVINIPFQIYSTFVIEEKYEFNKTSPKTFILDKIKGYLLTVFIGGILLSALIFLVMQFGSGFWIYFWVLIGAFMLFMNMFYASLILPLFNKLVPLEDGSLRQAIQEYASKVNFPLTNIFVIDGSKRSAKANAFFSGLGKKKKIVLYDTLIENHSQEELVAVLAHEAGHFKKKHIIYSMVFGILQTGFMLYILSLMINSSEVSWALGGQTTALHLNMLAFGILYSPVSTLLGIFGNLYSRKNEYEADEYAVKTYGGEPLKTALKKLTSDNLSNLLPHPWFVFVHYSHPTLLQRIRAMDAIN